MDEILDDEVLELKEKITFLKWWEGNRLIFNICISVLYFLTLVITVKPLGIDILLSAFKYFFVYLLIMNLCYVSFSIISFMYKLIIGKENANKKNNFSQNKILWKFLFIIQLMIAGFVVAVIVIGASSFVPFQTYG